ncbi:MAG: PSD1 and planctomycete cytochrome C domain-containing protein [Verrucomicrobiota bacterium]
MKTFYKLTLSLSIFAVTGLALLDCQAEVQANEAQRLFALSVKPMLVEKCFGCHGDDRKKIKGDLDLTTLAGTLKGGEESDQVLVPGDSKTSTMLTAVKWLDEDMEMPPKENDRLSKKQIDALEKWIKLGAPWPDDQKVAAIYETYAPGIKVLTSGGLGEEWTNRRYERKNLWAYQKVKKTKVPREFIPAKNRQQANPIDAFINRKLATAKLTAAPAADRRTLIRRASFDLTGLPPEPQQINQFIKDPGTDKQAFAHLVDRLLASPHYGEQWGRHWLDTVRYADSAGFANDYERPNAWRYRDYVIRSFNQDKAYDQFIREQLAGDEMDPSDSEKLIATGFLRMGPWEQTAMSVAKLTRQAFLDDVTNTVGQVFLGHTLRCAQCHDHKFDPIPTKDYYQMQAVFATTQFGDRQADFLAGENLNGMKEDESYLRKRIKQNAKDLQELSELTVAGAKQWCKKRGIKYRSRSQAQKQKLPAEQTPPQWVGLSGAQIGRMRTANKNKRRFQWELDRYKSIAFSTFSGGTVYQKNVQNRMQMPRQPMQTGKLETTSILGGGDPFAPTTKVDPGVLSAVHFDGDTDQKITTKPSGRRRDLANWIASPHNSLTARVMVNRIWQGHFGDGLAGNPNNFGATGKKPTHPELLDWLATQLVEKKWSIKALHRLIMNSDAYRRSSQHPDPQVLDKKDPNDTLYSRFKQRRLSAEELRDSMLACSGELNPEMGGIPVRPDINIEAALQPRLVMGTLAPSYQPNPKPEQRNRRSVYAKVIRGLRDPFMETFNQPGPNQSCERRDSSTVTPQVFSLFNSEESYDRSLSFAHSLLQKNPDRKSAISNAFQRVYGRPPTSEEIAACLKHWQAGEKKHATMKIATRKVPLEILQSAKEENTGEGYQYIERLETYADYVPDLQAGDVDIKTRALADICLVLFNSNEFVYIY